MVRLTLTLTPNPDPNHNPHGEAEPNPHSEAEPNPHGEANPNPNRSSRCIEWSSSLRCVSGQMMSAVEQGGAPQQLEAQLAVAERQWRELQTLRTQQLEASLRDAQEELASLRCCSEPCFYLLAYCVVSSSMYLTLP